jgi:transposase
MNRQQGKQKLDFQGEPIYVGIDVHKKQWTVFIMSGYKEHKGFVQPADAGVLGGYLRENFPGAIYYSVYEAGFCGFWPHEALTKEGIHNIVVSPADVPSTDKEKKRKSDKVDCRKLCDRLRHGDLQAIHVPSRLELENRELVRLRWRLVGDIRRTKNRIKSMLNLYGIKHTFSGWPKAFIKWLKEAELAYCNGTFALHTLVEELERLTELKNSVARQLRVGLVKNERYAEIIKHLCSIPGVGLTTALLIVTELGDIRRFPGIDQLCNYTGLVPTLHSSGDRQHVGNLTPRKNKFIMSVLIESAWTAVGKDPALMQTYHRLCKGMKGQEAIIRIARKLLARIRYVLLNQTPYQLRMVA